MIQYEVVYSGRRTIGISVTADKGVTVRAPYRTSKKTIERIVESKAEWIKKYLERYSGIIRLNVDTNFSDGNEILYRGGKFILRISKSAKNSVEISGNEIMVCLPSCDQPEKIRKLLRRWYNLKATELMGPMMNDILQRYAAYRFSPTGFSVKTMKRRWGSCTSKGKITLNSELIKLDDIYTEYVILHELCHLYHPNHGREYYRLLGEVFPDWKSVRKELKNYLG